MAGSNNENLLRAFKKDDINPIFDMFKSMRPKTVKNKGKISFLTELGEERPRINLNQHKKSIFINEENPNHLVESNIKRKRQTMANIGINFHFTNQSQNPNLNSINSVNSIQNNEINKLKKSNNNKILPKLNLTSINETNIGERKIRKNKRNKTTMVLNLNFGNKQNNEEKEVKENEEEKEENEEKEVKEEKEKLIQKTFEFKRKSTSASKNKVKNYFSKNDFKYFN
jgi:hypothetical protein